MARKTPTNPPEPTSDRPPEPPTSAKARSRRAIVDVTVHPEGWPNDPNADNKPITVMSKPKGRLSVDNSESFFGSPHIVLPPYNPEAQWSLFRLDSSFIQRMPPLRLMELLADMSPDVSRALWDFLRLCNPGFQFDVTTQRTGGQPDAVGYKMVEDFLVLLESYYGSIDVVIGRMFMSAFMRGALMAEMVLDADGRNMADLATPDPASVRFVRSQDAVRGPIWQLSQWQNRPAPEGIQAVAGYVPLLWPTIKYIPIDPFPGVPYGRPMASPALFTTLFLLGLLHDLRRVISQQGYPRLDISISMERLKASMPAKILNDPTEYKKWVNDTVAEVEDAYSKLEPDSTFVHTDVATINRPVGTVDSSSLGAIDGLIEALERMSTRALKTMPFMMASTQTTTETLANREWEVQSTGIRSIQKHCASMMSQLLVLGMRAQGHNAYVSWKFDILQKTEAFRDAQTQAVNIANAYNSYAHGFISLDQAAQMAHGQDADADAPRILLKGNVDTTAITDELIPRQDGTEKNITHIDSRIKPYDGELEPELAAV